MSGMKNENMVRLNNWTIKHNGNWYGISGNVRGHSKLEEGMSINTSAIVKIRIIKEEGIIEAITRNTIYHLELTYMNINQHIKPSNDELPIENLRQVIELCNEAAQFSELKYLKDWENIGEIKVQNLSELTLVWLEKRISRLLEYKKKMAEHDGYIELFFTDSPLYGYIVSGFLGGIMKNEKGIVIIDVARVHLGMGTDSYEISSGSFRFSYFNRVGEIEVYNLLTDNGIVVENAGDIPLKLKYSGKYIPINPKERTIMWEMKNRKG